jgi:ATP-dependent RNA helicase DDX49/DBP8
MRLFSSSVAAQSPFDNSAQKATDSVKFDNADDASTKIARDFNALGLAPVLIEALGGVSIERPTDIQAHCIPNVLAGKNVIGAAKTGSGKTAAFALPILHKLAEDPFGIFALVLTPARELAFQIAEQFKILGEGIRIRQSVVVGGMDMIKQAIELSKSPHIVIATPGRLCDLIRSSPDAVKFNRVRFLVIDEADRLLDKCFESQLSTIIGTLPTKRQTLLFSATITPAIEKLSTPSTFLYSTHNRYDTVEKLDQRFIIAPLLVRDAYLVWLLQAHLSGRNQIIVFVNKCEACERIRVMLRELNIPSTSLHSQMPQQQRLSSLAKFRASIVPILLITDVGSRGLDIPLVNVVINYDVPASATDYIHRVGRTSRAGRSGKSITLVTEFDVNLILNIEARTGKKMAAETVDEAEINSELLLKVSTAKRAAEMFLTDSQFGLKTKINKRKQFLIN